MRRQCRGSERRRRTPRECQQVRRAVSLPPEEAARCAASCLRQFTSSLRSAMLRVSSLRRGARYARAASAHQAAPRAQRARTRRGKAPIAGGTRLSTRSVYAAMTPSRRGARDSQRRRLCPSRTLALTCAVRHSSSRSQLRRLARPARRGGAMSADGEAVPQLTGGAAVLARMRAQRAAAPAAAAPPPAASEPEAAPEPQVRCAAQRQCMALWHAFEDEA